MGRIYKMFADDRRSYHLGPDERAPAIEPNRQQLANEIVHTDVKLAISGNLRIKFKE
jgi:hypothetical protein